MEKGLTEKLKIRSKYAKKGLIKKLNSLPTPVKLTMLTAGFLGSKGIGPIGGWSYTYHLFSEMGNYLVGKPANFGIEDVEKAVAYGGGFLMFETMEWLGVYTVGSSLMDLVKKKYKGYKIKKDEKSNISNIVSDYNTSSYQRNQNF